MNKRIKTAIKARNLKIRQDWPCEICGRVFPVMGMDVHLIVPGGKVTGTKVDTVENLIICCRSCHDAINRSEFKTEALLCRVKRRIEENKVPYKPKRTIFLFRRKK